MLRIDKSTGSRSGFSRRIQAAAPQDLLSDQEIKLVCRRLGHTWRARILARAVTARLMIHRAVNPDKSIRTVWADFAVVDD